MVLVTGAGGFIGQGIQTDHRTKSFRYLSRLKSNEQNWTTISDYNNSFLRSNLLKKVSTVIHLAAIAHMSHIDKSEVRKVNFHACLDLAEKAAKEGVKRFIYLSTVNVYGNKGHANIDTKTKPTNFASEVRLEVEQELYKIGSKTGMEIVIIRAPLVYGKNAPGNFGVLLNIAKLNLPLPLGAINNQRSFVAIDNLIDLIVTCIEHPNAANQTFLVSDDENISTSNLLKKLTIAAGKKPLLLPVPVPFLKFLAAIFGKKATVERFSSSLTVNIEQTKKILNWKPPITLDEGIRRCFK